MQGFLTQHFVTFQAVDYHIYFYTLFIAMHMFILGEIIQKLLTCQNNIAHYYVSCLFDIIKPDNYEVNKVL